MSSILAINTGSSSLKFKLFDLENDILLCQGIIDDIGKDAHAKMDGGVREETTIHSHADAFRFLVEALDHRGLSSQVAIVVHRVVHGGESYATPTVIDQTVRDQIRSLSSLSPLHNPVNLAGIEEAMKCFPTARQVAVFDTAYYAGMEPKAYLYGIPFKYYEKYRIRKYGFHGISHEHCAQRVLQQMSKRPLRHISCHLGNGSSITAILDGKPLDTTMGFSPLQGLMMGTRSGTIDPSIVAFLEEKEGLSPQQVDAMLNKQSGILGLSEISADVRDIYHFSKLGDERARLTLQMMAYQARRFIGEMIAVLGGVDVISFTAGIGENAFYIRKMALEGMQDLGVRIDDGANYSNRPTISTQDSEVVVIVLPADEERAMVEQVRSLPKESLGPSA